MFVRPGEKALVARDDQMRMAPAQLLSTQPLLLELAITKILDEDVGRREQAVQGVAILRPCKVEHDTALAPIEQRKEGDAHAAEGARLVACGRLDLYDLGAELRQDHAASRAHHHVGHLHDPYALQRQSSHRALPRLFSAHIMLPRA